MNNNLSELVVKTIDNMKFNTIYDCSKDIYTINITVSDELYNNKSEYRETEPFEYLYICSEELESFIHSDSLFARKFTPECRGLENLNELLNS